MVKLVRESRVATDLYFAQVLRELRAERVRIKQDNTITGHFLYNDDFKVFRCVSTSIIHKITTHNSLTDT